MNPETTHIDDFLGGAELEGSEQRQLHLWVSSDQVSFHQVELPDAPKSKWMALLPWILEDELLLPVEDMHLVICSVDTSRLASVLAIPKREMYRLQLLVEEESAKMRSFLPDVLALPLEEGFVTLAMLGDRLLARSGKYEGFSGAPDFVWQVLQLRREQGEIFQIQCFGMSSESLPKWAAELCSLNSNPINWQFAEVPVEANLLVGEFRAKTGRISFGPWIPSFGLAALAVFLLFSFAVVDHIKTGRELQLINQQLLREFEAAFAIAASSPELVQREGAQILRDRELRYFSVSDSILPVTEALDSVLSSCSDCDLASVQIDANSTTLVMKQDLNAISRLQSQAMFNLTSGEPNEQQQVVLNLQRQDI